MPDKTTIEKAAKDKAEGKSPSTQAGEFVHDEIKKIRKEEHGARSTKQAIAIGLSRARRAGVDLPQPEKGTVSEQTRKQAARDSKKGREHPNAKPNPRRSRATMKALNREGTEAASHENLSRQAKNQARQKTKAERSAIGRKAARTRAKNAAR